MDFDKRTVTGLVLAGGRSSRMGGADKGLQRLDGEPLARHVLRRLAPQVGALAINANRHLDEYGALGVPVWPDDVPGQPGPLAGLLTGLLHCDTPWLVSVPCDAPRLPADLVARLFAGLAAAHTELAIAATEEAGSVRRHPVFCLLHRTLGNDLAAHIAAGGRKVDDWASRRRCATVVFADGDAFVNVNTPSDLRRLEAGPQTG